MIRPDVEMTTGPLFSNLVRYAVPMILTNLLQMLYSAADMVVVGRFCGSKSVAAIGATGSLMALLVGLFGGLSVGVSVAVAHALGAGRNREVRHTVHTAVPLGVLGGLVLLVLGVVFAPTLLQWMATPADILDLSVIYMRVYFVGVPFAMLYNFAGAVLRAAGDSQSPLRFLTIAGVTNIVLNVLFVVVFHMDVVGVALATTISQAVSGLLVLWALLRRTDACRFQWRRMRMRKRPLMQILRIGLPSGVQSTMFSLSNVLLQSTINSFGAAAVSGNAAAANLDSFCFMVGAAVSATAMNFTGQNVGALKIDRVRRVLRITAWSMVAVAALSAVALLGAGEWLLSLFITDSPEAIRYGILRLSFVALPYVLAALQDVLSSVVRGMGNSAAPMVVSVLGICVFRVAWLYTVFPLWPTMESVYLTYPISWLLVLVAMVVVYRRTLRRLYRRAAADAPETPEASPAGE